MRETIGALRAATPMIHVPDVRATAAWYEAIGFTVLETYDDGADGLSFAILSAGETRVMFNQGGRPLCGILSRSAGLRRNRRIQIVG